MAAYQLLASQKYEITALLTTVTEGFDRISMHGVRRELLERQADSLGIPLHKILIPQDCSNEIYEARMREAMNRIKAQGITKIAFGDLFLQDVKSYRDERLAQAGMTGLYPIWMRDTDELVRTFIGLGFKAILACVDTQALDASFAGREIDLQLLERSSAKRRPVRRVRRVSLVRLRRPHFQERHRLQHRRARAAQRALQLLRHRRA